MPSSPVSRRKQKIHASQTSMNTNLTAINYCNHHNGQTQQKRGGRTNQISTIQRKRYVWILCIVIATSCALWLRKVQHFRIGIETMALDDENVRNEIEPKDNARHEIGAAPPIINQQRVRFIPYPHKTLGSGDSIQCKWETIHNRNTSSSSLLDFTQRNAYTQGVCIPPTLSDTLHIFSSDEAIQCLSSEIQQRDIRVILSGDSYMKQLYIGLADILLSKHISDDKEMKDNVQRSKILANAQYWMNKRRETNATFPYVQYQCEEDCYGKKALDICSQCINSFSRNNSLGDDAVWVVGVGIHTYARVKKQVDVAIQHIQHFLDTEGEHKRIIYVSPPKYFYRDDYPDQTRNMELVYRGLLPHVAPENTAHPFLDVYELTKSCTMENCTFDGGHRSRYVNRWKAQLLLNTLCEVQ